MGFLLHSSRNRRRLEESDLGQTICGFPGRASVGVVLPLWLGLTVSGESTCHGANLRALGALEFFHVRLASLTTREQTPRGGAVPGSILNGV